MIQNISDSPTDPSTMAAEIIAVSTLNQEQPLVEEPAAQELAVKPARKSRFRLSQEQSSKLENFYQKKQKANNEEKKNLAEATGIEERQVAKWFENKRRTQKKKVCSAAEEAEESLQVEEAENAQETQVAEAHVSRLAAITPKMFQTFNSVMMAIFMDCMHGSTDDQMLAAIPKIQTSEAATETESIPQEEPSAPMEEPKESEKKRKKFTAEQLEILETAFESDRAPSLQDRTKLAARINLTRKQVSRWFQNHRHLKRKSVREVSVAASSDYGEEPEAKKAKEDVEA